MFEAVSIERALCILAAEHGIDVCVAHLTEALRARLAEMTPQQLRVLEAVIEIGKLGLPIPKQQAPRIERGKPT